MKTIKKQLLFLSVFAPLYIGTSLQASMNDELAYLEAVAGLSTLVFNTLSPKKSSAPSKTSSPVTASSPNQPRNEKLSNFFSRLFNSKPTTESASAIATRQNELDPLGTTSPVATSSPQPKTHNSIVPSGTPESNLQITQGSTPARSKGPKKALTFNFNSPTGPSNNDTSIHFKLTKEQVLRAIRLCQKNDITPPIFNGSAMQVSTTKTPSPVGDRSLWSENMNRKPAGTPFADNVSPLKNDNDGSFSLQLADGSFLLVEANGSITLHNKPTTPKSAKKDLFDNTHESSITEITEITDEGDNGTTTSADTSYSFEVDESPQAQDSKSEIENNQDYEPMVLAKPLDKEAIREIARSLPPLKFPVMQKKEWIATYTSTPVKIKAEQQQAVNGSQEVYSPAAKNVSSTFAAVHTLETENPEAFKKQIQQLRKEQQELSIALGFQEAKTRVALQKVEELGQDNGKLTQNNQALLQEYQKTAKELKQKEAEQITSSLVHQAFMEAQTEIYTENLQTAAEQSANQLFTIEIQKCFLDEARDDLQNLTKKHEKVTKEKKFLHNAYRTKKTVLKKEQAALKAKQMQANALEADLRAKQMQANALEAALKAQQLETKKAKALTETLQNFNNNQKTTIDQLVEKQSTFTHQCADTIDATVAWMKKNKIKTTLGVAAVTGLYGACWYKGRGTSLPFMNSFVAPRLTAFATTYGNPAISIVKNFCAATFTKSATTTVKNGINTVPSILLNPFS